MSTQGGPIVQAGAGPGPPLHPAHHDAGTSEFPWLTGSPTGHYDIGGSQITVFPAEKLMGFSSTVITLVPFELFMPSLHFISICSLRFGR